MSMGMTSSSTCLTADCLSVALEEKLRLAAEFHAQQSDGDVKQASDKPEAVGENEAFFQFDFEDFR